MVEENSNMILDTGDKPSSLRWILLALQHVCVMFGATILVPIVVNTTAGTNILSIPVTLVSSGLGTLIYLICTRNRSPVYLGSSFAFITLMAAGYAIGGTGSVFTALMIVGIVYVIISLIIRVFGPEWINKLLPPIVVGPMIIVIGLSSAPAAIQQIGLDLTFVPWTNLLVASISFLITAIVAVRGRGILKVIPIIIRNYCRLYSCCIDRYC